MAVRSSQSSRVRYPSYSRQVGPTSSSTTIQYLQPPGHPLAAKQLCGEDITNSQQKRLPHLHNALPIWQPAHDPAKFTYTDGSTKEGCPILGAAVYHAPTQQITLHINATGIAECNTIVRAEVIAIYEALQQYPDLQELHILTDSLTAIKTLTAKLPAHAVCQRP